MTADLSKEEGLVAELTTVGDIVGTSLSLLIYFSSSLF
jgi:hypothetical protein